MVAAESDAQQGGAGGGRAPHPHAGEPVFDLHVGGKMEIVSTVALNGPDELSLAYTPGVAQVCEAIAADPSLTQHYTWVPNTVAVVSDGTAVLGLGDIGPAAAMPVMEGKAVLFKQFGGVDAIPICLDTTDTEEIIETVARLPPLGSGHGSHEDDGRRHTRRQRGPRRGHAGRHAPHRPAPAAHRP